MDLDGLWELYAVWAWFLVFARETLYDEQTAACAMFAVMAAGGLGCAARGLAGDRVGGAETTIACMAVAALRALDRVAPSGLASRSPSSGASPWSRTRRSSRRS